jgi:hypothetical protein
MKNEKLNTIKSTGFKTPDNYFESLEDCIYSKMLEDKLPSINDSSGFKVPEDYFDTLDYKVLNAIEIEESSKVVSLFNWKKVAYLSGIAASIILVFNLFIKNSNKLTFDNLETASIENYLLNEDLNAYDIAPYLGTDSLDSDDFIENTMNASDIEDYLLLNSDVEQLIID